LERANLLKMEPEKAITEIQRLKREQFRSFARSGRSHQGPLNWGDVDTIDKWLQDRALNNKDKILAKASQEDRDWFESLSDDRKGRFLTHLAARGEGGPPTLDENEWQQLLDRLPTVKGLFASQGKTIDELDALKASSKDVKKEIQDDILKAKTLAEKQSLLFKWHREAQFARMAVGGGVPREELNRFFKEELSDKEREELLALPADQFHKRLRWAYYRRDFPPGWQPQFGRGWGRGKGGGRRGDGGDRGGFDRGRRDGPPRFEHGPPDQFQRENGPPGEKRRRGPFNDDGPRRPPPDDGGARDQDGTPPSVEQSADEPRSKGPPEGKPAPDDK
jgi:hypothetical protein